MGYRDILVQIDDTAASGARAAAAAALAARWSASLTGLFLKTEFLRQYMAGEALTYMRPEDIDTLLKDHAGAVEKASERARALFEQAAGEAGVMSDWRVVDGDSDTALIDCARRFDLTVFPPEARPSLGDQSIPAADLGMACGGPVLVIPEGATGAGPGERIVVAWKGARESARALRDAWPFLMAAKEVHVVVVSPQGEGGPDGLLQRHLENHGCTANLIIDRSYDASAADILRRQIKTLDADLLVMGLYGRPRIQEMILGGVSRDLLGDPPTAMLISH